MPHKLGILAGQGALPRMAIAACQRAGRSFFVLAFKDQTDTLTTEGVPHAWVRLGASAEGLKELRKAGVDEVVMVGAIRRPSVAAMRPDARMARFLAKAGATALKGDDGFLAAAVRELEDIEHLRVVPLQCILPDSLASIGQLGAHDADADSWADIHRGVAVALALGAHDVGQGVVVHGGLVLAVEAAEGTDAMLVRAAMLKRDGPGGVLVKVAKPQQERRADLPAIGAATVEGAFKAGLRGIAVESGATILVERDKTIAAADALGLFLIGVAPEDTVKSTS